MSNVDKIVFGNNEEYFDEIYPNIWIMHNHKWALYCWEQYRERNEIPSTLVHLDYHWDVCNDYSKNESTIRDMNLNEMQDVIIENTNIRKDSFIAPAIIRGYGNRVDFHCYQKDTIGFDTDFLNRYNAIENIHDKIEDLILAIGSQEIILDLDLDIFNTLGTKFGVLWEKEKIESYINTIIPLIKQAKVITIAMSYGHTGNDDDIEYLTKLVVQMIVNIKKT
jgi:hypothetical protein